MKKVYVTSMNSRKDVPSGCGDDAMVSVMFYVLKDGCSARMAEANLRYVEAGTETHYELELLDSHGKELVKVTLDR